VFGTLTRDGC